MYKTKCRGEILPTCSKAMYGVEEVPIGSTKEFSKNGDPGVKEGTGFVKVICKGTVYD